jgi:hypothetical protein
MSVEWGNYLHTLLATVLSLYFVFSLVVKVALNCHRFEAEFVFELIQILTSPRKVAFVLGCHINWDLLEIFEASVMLCLFILAFSLLILSKLVDEDCTA